MADYSGAENYAFDLLRKLSPEVYFYHNLEHTIEVRDAAIVLTGGEKVHGEERELILKPAAVYHDIGFIEKYDGHEEVSVRIASEVLPQFGYPAEAVKRIGKVIAATGHRRPRDLLEEIICDADTNYLGGNNPYLKKWLLRQELIAQGIINPGTFIKEWLKGELSFLESHTYFTGTAMKLWKERKADSYQKIREIYALEDDEEIQLAFKNLFS